MFARIVAKHVVSSAYHIALTSISTAAISAVVQPEEDSFDESLCELGGAAFGTVVWWKTAPKVTSVVDVVADKRLERKLAKQTEITE